MAQIAVRMPVRRTVSVYFQADNPPPIFRSALNKGGLIDTPITAKWMIMYVFWFETIQLYTIIESNYMVIWEILL